MAGSGGPHPQHSRRFHDGGHRADRHSGLSANAAFFTAYGTQERKRTVAEYRDLTIADTIPGIAAPGIMTALVIMVAAKVFNGPLGPDGMVSTIGGLAKVFQPVAGPAGT